MKIHCPDSSSPQNPGFNQVVELQKAPNEMYQDLLRTCALIATYCLAEFLSFSLWCFDLDSLFDLFLKENTPLSVGIILILLV